MFKTKKVVLAAAISAAVVTSGVAVTTAIKTTAASAGKTQVAAALPQTKVDSEEELNQKITQIKANDKAEVINYTVKSGDTLEAIARQYGIKVGTIELASNIGKNQTIREGQVLVFPSIDGVIYKIKGNETLWNIATLYNVKVDDIAKANSLTAPESIKVGQSVIIPGAFKYISFETNKSPAKEVSAAAKPKKVTKVTVASRGKTVSTVTASNSSVYAGIIWPLSGRFSSSFGQRGGEFHKGVDIAAPTGTRVSAALSGTVAFSGTMNGYGNIIILDHGNGMQTYYAHLSKRLVSVGESISKGQEIGKVGTTGRVTGPHLHFEIRFNGNPANPMAYLK